MVRGREDGDYPRCKSGAGTGTPGHSVDWAMSLLTELGSTKSLLYIAGFLDLRVKFSFAVCFDKVRRVLDDAFALWKRKMKRRHPEGQRSIQSYFEQQAKSVASASGEGQEIGENADRGT
eukprot:scpid39437/ scgid30578/ 